MPPRIQQFHKFGVLDSWRGVAALLVALFHLNIAGTIYSLGFVRNSYLFVDFFFVLSGFVITHGYADRLATPEQLGTFAFRRLGRLWPLHATVLLAFVIAESGKAVLATRGMSFYFPPFTGPYAPELIPLNLAFGQSFGIQQHLSWNPPSWSICAEFWTYLIFAGALYIANTLLWRFRFAAEFLMVALLIGSATILVLFAQHGMDATFDLGLVRCLCGFVVGHLTYRIWQQVGHLQFRTGLWECAAVVAVITFISAVGQSGYSLCAPLLFGVVVFILAFERGPVSRLMSNPASLWFGKISYSIYMWQAFIIFNFVDRPVSIFEKITGRVLTTTEGADSALGGEAAKLIVFGGHLAPVLATLLYLTLVVAVAGVSYHLIEKPGQDLFARLAHWRRGSSVQSSVIQ